MTATCPKLAELEKVLEECRENDAKVIVFSEWERMLELVRDLCERARASGYAWHTGSVPQQRRRAEINAFKDDPHCRVFLSTDSRRDRARTCKTPAWSSIATCRGIPAKLEQRIARAWRKHQTKPVTVINLVSENTIEHRMLDTLANQAGAGRWRARSQRRLERDPLAQRPAGVLERLQQSFDREPAPAVTDGPASTAGAARRPAAGFRPTGPRSHQWRARALRGTLSQPTARTRCCWWSWSNATPSLRERVAAVHADLFGPGKSDPLAPTQLR